MSITTPEQLLREYAPTPQSRAMATVIERRIEAMRDQIEFCADEEVKKHQGAIAALRSLHRLVCGQPE